MSRRDATRAPLTAKPHLSAPATAARRFVELAGRGQQLRHSSMAQLLLRDAARQRDRAAPRRRRGVPCQWLRRKVTIHALENARHARSLGARLRGARLVLLRLRVLLLCDCARHCARLRVGCRVGCVVLLVLVLRAPRPLERVARRLQAARQAGGRAARRRGAARADRQGASSSSSSSWAACQAPSTRRTLAHAERRRSRPSLPRSSPLGRRSSRTTSSSS